MNEQKKDESILVRVDKKMHDDLKILAKEADRRVADYVRVHLKKIIEEIKASGKFPNQ